MRTQKLTRLLPYLAVDAAIIITILLLAQIDWIVHNSLYNYGLTFSEEWARFYWTLLRIIIGMLVFAFATITILGVFSYKKAKKELSRTVYVCKSCGTALTRLTDNISVKEDLPNFRITKECPSCSKKMLED